MRQKRSPPSGSGSTLDLRWVHRAAPLVPIHCADLDALEGALAKTQQAQEPAPAPQFGPMLAVTAEEIAQAAGQAFSAVFVAALGVGANDQRG